MSDHPMLRNLARFGPLRSSAFDNKAGQIFLDVDTDEEFH